ncbi:MAG: 4'-phosphopantetheinyl transferase superfamily protein [Candidatus Eremiobacteraeota bacterium]|nr:4'-phosphopantetheinyl transferase superfamily protein [Candidatus Eremiobacteraeota bacterium]
MFPAGVVAAELRRSAAIAELHPAEMSWCATFSAKRTADFAAGRLCAKRALREFGHVGFALHVGVDRRPCWPADVVGSISHTTSFCGAVVAPSRSFESIGFDAETVGGVDPELWPALFTPAESGYLRSLPASERATMATVFFSAIESFYKCHFGVTPTWLDFVDVLVTPGQPGTDRGSFDVRAAREDGGPYVQPRTGRYARVGDIILTGVADMRGHFDR